MAKCMLRGCQEIPRWRHAQRVGDSSYILNVAEEAKAVLMMALLSKFSSQSLVCVVHNAGEPDY